METDLPDEVLMRRAACGDDSAFDRLFARHGEAVYRFVARMLHDSAAAEDVTQECFLRAWRARESYTPSAAFRTWLFTIARRLTLDCIRRERSRADRRSPQDDGSRMPVVKTMDRLAAECPERLLISRELCRAIERAVNSLSPSLREVVLLRDSEHLSYDEIASVLGCPLGTVKWRLNAARRILRNSAVQWLEDG